MRKVMIIGIGAGHPDYVTIQAVNAMNEVDVFFIPDKGMEKAELARLRLDIIERHVTSRPVRTVGYRVPSRRKDDDYRAAVSDWHDDVEAVYGRLIMEELGASQTGAFLVWGDPTLYDSTLRIIERLRARDGFEFEYEVLPGISSVQALAARHRVALNTIGQSVLITNGRSAHEGFPNNVDSIVVMLNTDKALSAADGDLHVYWGAYVGMPDEILVEGTLKEVLDDIQRIRDEARGRNGWIMDSALLRKRHPSA